MQLMVYYWLLFFGIISNTLDSTNSKYMICVTNYRHVFFVHESLKIDNKKKMMREERYKVTSKN